MNQISLSLPFFPPSNPLLVSHCSAFIKPNGVDLLPTLEVNPIMSTLLFSLSLTISLKIRERERILEDLKESNREMEGLRS